MGWREHNHTVAFSAQALRQGAESRGVDAIVVGQQNLHSCFP
jgi:hypothetical protein